MASKGVFESKSGSRERGAIWQNIADNLNNCEEFAVTTWSHKDPFITPMKKYKSKTRQEIKGTGLGSEELFEDRIEGFEESEYRMEAVNQKKSSLISKPKKKKGSSRNKKKSNKRFGETRKCKEHDESDTCDKEQSRSCSSKVVGFLRSQYLVFFEKDLNKIANSD